VVGAAHAVLPDVLAHGYQDPTAAVELLATVAWQVSSSVFKGPSKPLDKNREEIERLERLCCANIIRVRFSAKSDPDVTSCNVALSRPGRTQVPD
jgi:hypothetical protein